MSNESPDQSEPELRACVHCEDKMICVDCEWLCSMRKILNEFVPAWIGSTDNPAWKLGGVEAPGANVRPRCACGACQPVARFLQAVWNGDRKADLRSRIPPRCSGGNAPEWR